ncbi:hypothetical protein HOF92_14355 [bacterium]|jgi:hypothetical protein|nr:hypothetical protein [bacterium]
MSLLQSQYWYLLFFALVPILLHLFKRQKARKIHISSLYLLHRKARVLNRRIKLHQWLLLASRILLVVFLAFYFLRPLLKDAPALLSKWLPHREPTLAFLDTRWDSSDSLRQELIQRLGKTPTQDLRFKEIFVNKGQTLLQTVREGLSGSESRILLISRFYSTTNGEIKELRALGMELFPAGPPRIINTIVSELKITPQNPLLGENVDISGVVHTIDPSLEKVEISLLRPGRDPQKRSLQIKAKQTTDFSFSIQADRTPLEVVEVRHDALDEVEEDDSATLEIPVRSKFRIALVDDKAPSESKRSRLYFLRKFFDGLNQSFPKINFEMTNFQSASFLQSSTGVYDWILVGDLSTQFFPRNRGKIFFFWQKTERMRRFLDEKLGMRSYALETNSQDLNLLTIPASDRPLVSNPWQVHRYLQVKAPQSTALIQGGRDPLLLESNGIFFSSFDFSEYDFSGIFDPYFPIFLYRFFFERWDRDDTLPQASFPITERSTELSLESRIEEEKTEADLSFPILLLVLFFCLAELYLILKLERAIQSNGVE